jgi:N-acetylglucosaminyl-diphospho-decaprenol L-rhamnosyltransferase
VVTIDDVTLVVITRNRSRRLLDTLAKLVRSGAAVIVVDNGSSDDTVEQVRSRFPSVLILQEHANRGAAARTPAVALASTEFVAFSDDDSWWEPDALLRGLQALRDDPRLGLVAARVLVGPERRLDPVSLAMRESPLWTEPALQGPRILGFVACAAICRRDAYLATAGFHPRYGVGGEEALLALDLARHGFACVYLDEVVAHHHPARPSSDTRSRRRRQRTVARNDLWTAWLRLPLRDALARTAAILREPSGLQGLARATWGMVWVTRQRRAVPAALARDLRSLDERGHRA